MGNDLGDDNSGDNSKEEWKMQIFKLPDNLWYMVIVWDLKEGEEATSTSGPVALKVCFQREVSKQEWLWWICLVNTLEAMQISNPYDFNQSKDTD